MQKFNNKTIFNYLIKILEFIIDRLPLRLFETIHRSNFILVTLLNIFTHHYVYYALIQYRCRENLFPLFLVTNEVWVQCRLAPSARVQKDSPDIRAFRPRAPP